MYRQCNYRPWFINCRCPNYNELHLLTNCFITRYYCALHTAGPKVIFNTTELVIRESNTTDVFVPIVIARTVPDPDFDMPAVKLRSIESGEDDAMFGVDFDLPANESCPEGTPGVSCVTFAPNQTTAVLHVIIKHDQIVEVNESFHLAIISSYRWAPYGMKITILESAPRKLVKLQ